MTTEDIHRIRARDAIRAARRGHLPKPSSSSSSVTSTPTATPDLDAFNKAQENSIEVYDDKFGRNSILTRSARMRKFKFYQYKPIYDSPSNNTSKLSSIGDQESEPPEKNPWISNLPSTPTKSILSPREDVLQGKLSLGTESSEELSNLDAQIVELEKQIADLNSNNNVGNMDKIFELVNKKNDLLRRQMQLNILDKERALEKANDELIKELRSLMVIDDSRKTKAQLDRQQYLYEQSVALVNRRNELVHHMDVQERGIEEDEAMKATLKRELSNKSTFNGTNNFSQADQNCCIQ